MKKALLTLLVLASTTAFAKEDSKYRFITGKDALEDQYLNQYDDVTNPPQGYKVRLSKGYTLSAVDVNSNGNTICGVSAYDWEKQTFTIDGFSLETDEQGCEVTLSIYEEATRKTIKAVYSIEQVGT